MLYIVSADYDYSLNCIVLKLYNTDTEKLEYYYDTVFKPYFYSREKQNFEGIIKQEQVERYDALHDEQIRVWKVTVKSPDIIRTLNRKLDTWENQQVEVWENHIKFIMRYIYDNDIKMGMPYLREGGMLLLNMDKNAEIRVKEITELVKPETYNQIICEQLTKLLEYTAPEFKRVSLDAEVLSEGNKIPSPSSANLPVICVCMVSNTGEKHAFILIQEEKEFTCPEDANISWFSDEAELLEAVFKFGSEYPFIITFNGDDFDLPYLMNRAIRLGIPIKNIPITHGVKEKIAYWKDAIHIDLYKFFSIKSMQNYAFQQKYKNVTLDEVSKALIKEGKTKGVHEWVNDMTYEELLTYCLNDANITIKLTTYSDNVVMNLILVLARLSYMPIELVSRKPISQWIRSFIYYEHHKRNTIIPRTEDIKAMKGETITKALIKGKKYKGAIVVNPIAGFHFNVKVGDFASLYPSIIKNWNLGYATVNCPHDGCKSNTFAGMKHWICLKNRAIESQLIGTLKDLRVKWYKKMAKDKNNPLKPWYSVAEQSIKVICNASYGVFGDEKFVLYCPPMPEYVTGIGRWIITQTIQHAQELELNVIAGDTDSVFFKNPPPEVLDQLLTWAKTQFDIDFELDKDYRYVCLSDRKKNYFGVLKDGTVDVKGLTGKKKHTPQIIKTPFEETKKILAQIYTETDTQKGKTAILKLVKETYTKLKTRNFGDMENLAFHVTASKDIDQYDSDPQHIKAAKLLQRAGYDIGEGSDISFVKTKDKLKVKPTKLAKPDDIDVSKYTEYLKNTFIQVLEPLGLDWDKDILGCVLLDSYCSKE
jgi:DNA polymerase I